MTATKGSTSRPAAGAAEPPELEQSDVFELPPFARRNGRAEPAPSADRLSPHARRAERWAALTGWLQVHTLVLSAGAAVLVALAACSSATPAAGPSAGRSAPGGPATVRSTSTGANSPPTAQTSANGPADACRLITPAEAQVALGKQVRSPKARSLGPTGQGASCTYESTDFANGTAAGLALTITYFPVSSMTKSQFDTNFGGNGARAVPGLGDGAWYLGGILNVYAHGANLSVAIVSLRTEATVDQLTTVAKLALGRI